MSDTAAITLRQIVKNCRGMLLDFDGPVTVLFPNGSSRAVAEAMREVLDTSRLPAELLTTRDPLALLRWAQPYAPDYLDRLEQICREGEVAAAQSSHLTPGISDALVTMKDHNYPVAIVSNNDSRAVCTSLQRHGLDRLVSTVCARPPGHPELMKPHRHLIDKGATALRLPQEEVFLIGDSVSDIEVSLATGVTPVGWAKTHSRGLELRNAGAAVVIDTPAEIPEAFTIGADHG